MYNMVEWGWGAGPQCDNTGGARDLGTEDLFSVFAAGLHIPKLILVLSEPPFPPLYIDVDSKGPPGYPSLAQSPLHSSDVA